METAGRRLERLRVDHVGSLVNPPFLIDAFADHQSGRISDADLRRAQDRAITEAIRKQEAIGFPVVSDGEMRRRNFQEAFAKSVSGFDAAPDARFDFSGVSEQPYARAE